MSRGPGRVQRLVLDQLAEPQEDQVPMTAMPIGTERTCAWPGCTADLTGRSDARYCSDRCRRSAYRERARAARPAPATKEHAVATKERFAAPAPSRTGAPARGGTGPEEGRRDHPDRMAPGPEEGHPDPVPVDALGKAGPDTRSGLEYKAALERETAASLRRDPGRWRLAAAGDRDRHRGKPERGTRAAAAPRSTQEPRRGAGGVE